MGRTDLLGSKDTPESLKKIQAKWETSPCSCWGGKKHCGCLPRAEMYLAWQSEKLKVYGNLRPSLYSIRSQRIF